MCGITTAAVTLSLPPFCRGAYDEAYVTALGPSTACVTPCKDYRGADICGGDYAISLYRLTGVQYDTGAGVCAVKVAVFASLSWLFTQIDNNCLPLPHADDGSQPGCRKCLLC
jgi:hypothetical protein